MSTYMCKYKCVIYVMCVYTFMAYKEELDFSFQNIKIHFACCVLVASAFCSPTRGINDAVKVHSFVLNPSTSDDFV